MVDLVHSAEYNYPCYSKSIFNFILKSCFQEAAFLLRIVRSGEIDGTTTEELLQRYQHPFTATIGKEGALKGAPNEMNYIMDYRLIYCLHHGLPLDMDVYDAAEWSCITELSEQSVLNGSRPVEIPDFTRGAWEKNLSETI